MDPIDTATLPPLLAQILAYATLVLALLTAFAHGLIWLVPRLRVIAMRTTTKRDDDFVDWLARAGVSFAAALDIVQIFIPRVSMGRPSPSLPETSTSTVTVTRTEAPAAPAIPPMRPPPINGPDGSALVVLLTLATLALLAPSISSCGAAGQVTAGAACSSLMLAIGEHRTYDAERAETDISTVREVCDRLTAAPVDGGAP